MDSVLTSDIFFFITSIAVAIVTTLIVILLVSIIRLVRNISGIVERVREGTDALSEDMGAVRSKLKEKGLMSALIVTIMHAASKRFDNNKK
jgi:hypothetical protein